MTLFLQAYKPDSVTQKKTCPHHLSRLIITDKLNRPTLPVRAGNSYG